MDIFGFTIDRKDHKPIEAFSPKLEDDGAIQVVEGGLYGGSHALLLSEGAAKTEGELIMKYREMAEYPEVDEAIDDIVNEAITNDPDEDQVKIVLDKLDQPDTVKKLIEKEFTTILEMYEFKTKSYEIFRQWYIDGRIYYHMIIDSENVGRGIVELRYVDPRKIRKVRETARKKVGQRKDTLIPAVTSEYYVYSGAGFSPSRPTIITDQVDLKGVKIAKDSIAYVTSGLLNKNGDMVLSYLNKALRSLNQLKQMEDAFLIYYLVRAPERRVFYIDVGTLPKAKAEQHIKEMMTMYKNKVVYDSATGTVKDDRKFMTMLEDFWLARRGDRGTEISSLPAGANLSDMEAAVNYWLKKLQKSLNVPSNRNNPESTFTLGKDSMITREEIKFQKFIDRLRLRFQNIFTIPLGKQLILKGIVTEEDWKEFRQKIDYRFSRDNFFSELKDVEIMNERMNLLERVDNFQGKYFSKEEIKKNVLRQTDEEIEKLQQQMDEEGAQEASEMAAKDDAEREEAAAKDQADKEHELNLAAVKSINIRKPKD